MKSDEMSFRWRLWRLITSSDTVMTRPDIAFAVSQVAEYFQNPRVVHWKAVKRIFSYLANTVDYEISFECMHH